MCLKIVTHTMVCDVRPVIRHPSHPTSHIIDPFAVLQDIDCVAASKPGGGLQCPAHKCCQSTVRSFLCDCGKIVGYHRYIPAKTPCAYTIETASVPSPGVWRKLESLDEVSSSGVQAQPAPSEELQIARLGFQHAVAQLGPAAKSLEAASRKKNLKEQNLKNGAPYEKQVQAAHKELERMATEALEVQTAYYTWIHMMEIFEQLEHGKTSAVEMEA
ncbi:hypothetical protein GGR51DRAFT_523026 [Nemania sp. FL0031]|nr:hypothetical protein GGR51DRAFT_523026 [Nemania sp. FL0031]